KLSAMSSLLALIIARGPAFQSGLLIRRAAMPLCTASPSKPAPPPAPGAKTRHLSPACQQHLDKFLSTVNSIDKSSGKAGSYKNPEYFVFDDVSFYDYEMAMESKRLPQPESKLTAF
ncbi:hypothetical protein BOX15_Mlig006671g1, partial [Macrostomum lignano]